jgi:hypothetical protein
LTAGKSDGPFTSVRPSSQTVFVGLLISFTPAGNVPLQPGGTSAYAPAFVPVDPVPT